MPLIPITARATVYDEQENIDPGASVSMQMIEPPAAGIHSSKPRVRVAGEDGIVEFTNCFVGATYAYWKGTAPQRPANAMTFDCVASEDGTQELPAIVGNRGVRT
jgi:hypothetical protein